MKQTRRTTAMNKYTNTGLVSYAKSLLKLKTKYMWGGLCRPITTDYINQLKKYYKSQYPAARVAKLSALVGNGYYGIDCVGVAKSYIMGGVGSPEYTAAKDLNAGALYQKAKEKGAIGTMPERPGVMVYCKSSPHVGVYIGNGYVIESTLSSRGDGVVKTKLSAFKWEYWFQNPFVEADNAAETVSARLKYSAIIRAEPKSRAAAIGRIAPGSKVEYVKGSEVKDKASGFTYVKIANGWIVKSAV